MSVYVGKSIQCLNCGGQGYRVTTSWDGTKRPMICKACKGSGKQKVRA